MSEIKVNSIKGVGASAAAITVNNSDGTCRANITNNLSNRNKVINGAMTVSQRNGTSAVTTVNAYNIDRWQNVFSGTIGAYSFSQSTDSPDGFANSYKIDVTTADTSLGSTDVHYFRTALEGQDVQDFAKGTSSAKKFTLSFYVKTTKTGTYIVNLTDADNSRECSASYTVSNTNWNRYTVSFPADTTGAFTNDNNVSLRVLFALSGGSAFQSGTLSTSWATSADANRLVGQVNLADNTSNEWLITGIQLEVDHTGSGKATDFEHRSYAQEYDLCRRYYERWEGASFNPFLMAMAYQTTIAYAPFFWYPKRDVPSLEYSNISHFDRLKSASSSVSSAITNLTLTNTGPKFNYGNLYFNHDSMTGGQAILFRNSNNSGWIAISSEL